MALKKCRECGNQVSTKADKCPSCGAPPRAQAKGSKTAFKSILGIGVLIALFSLLLLVLRGYGLFSGGFNETSGMALMALVIMGIIAAPFLLIRVINKVLGYGR